MRVDLREGGTYTLSMQRISDGQVVTAHGIFQEVIVPSRLVYTWNWDGAFPDMPQTRVTVEFRAASDGTEVSLCQDDLSMRVCGSHLTGWMKALNRLETACTLAPPDALRSPAFDRPS